MNIPNLKIDYQKIWKPIKIMPLKLAPVTPRLSDPMN